MSNLLQQLGEALNPNNTDMKDILKQEWEVFSNRDMARGVVELRDGDNDVICARMNSTNNRLLFNHLATTHNFCKDIPDEVMAGKPYIDRLKQRLDFLKEDLAQEEKKALHPYGVRITSLSARVSEMERLINELTGK